MIHIFSDFPRKDSRCSIIAVKHDHHLYLRIDSQSQLLLNLLRCNLEALALCGAPPLVDEDGGGADVLSAGQDADGTKKVVGGSSDILEDDKVEKVVITRRKKDLTYNHTHDIGEKEDKCEQKSAENVS